MSAWNTYLDGVSEVHTMTYALMNCLLDNLKYLKSKVKVYGG